MKRIFLVEDDKEIAKNLALFISNPKSILTRSWLFDELWDAAGENRKESSQAADYSDSPGYGIQVGC